MATLIGELPSLASIPLSPQADWECECNSAFRLSLNRILTGETPVTLHFQPIVDLVRGVTVGYETLSRFPAVMGPAPDLCFEAAGRVGRRLALEEVVIRSALIHRELLPPDCFLSINMSPSFLASPHWQSILADTTDLAGVVIEITEEESIHDYEIVRVRLAQIRALSGSVAVDDAGSGYASLKHVVEMKPSFIKLDRLFVSNCHSERAKSTLIEMMGRAANRLDSWIIAEGIETREELEELIQLGVPLGQGYFLGRPDPVMAPLPEEQSEAIRSRAQQQRFTDRLSRHLEICPTRRTQDAAHQLFSNSTTLAVVVTDKWNRPLHIVERHPVLGIRDSTDLMKIQLLSDPAEVLQRALTRPAATRFDPCIVIDRRGELQGIVRIDRLMRGVLDVVAST